MKSKICERLLKELSNIIGLSEQDKISPGGRIRVGDQLVTFIHDEQVDADNLCIYGDFGLPSNNAGTFEKMLKINFELDVTRRGILSIHPATGHAMFSFRLPLDNNSTGQILLDSIALAVADVAFEGAACV